MRRAFERMGRLAAVWGPVLAILVACSPIVERPERPSAPRAGASGLLTPGDRAVLERLTDDPLHAVEAEPDGPDLVAHNQAHDLQLHFSPDGVGVASIRPDAPWTLALQLVSYGRGDQQEPAEPVRPTAHGRTVEYQRTRLTEWYVNERRGLEQGFTLAALPAGPREYGPIRLVVGAAGPATAVTDPDERGLTWRDDAGQDVARYTGLVARDAEGRDLPARLILAQDAIWLEVDDTTAAYPLTVDPLIEQAKLTAPGSFFGNSVALSADGGTALVGASFSTIGGNTLQGSAYVFVRPRDGWATTSAFAARLTASDGAMIDEFGHSVALSADGGTALIGAYLDDVGPNDNQGSAYVFVRPPGGWATATETAKLTASTGHADDVFGDSVALDADGAIALVGAYLAPVGGNAIQGSAYVFVRPGGGWSTATETARLTSTDGAAGDFFGHSVSLGADGATALIGAPLWVIGGYASPGSAYVFTRPRGGWATTSTFAARLTSSDGAGFDQFGYSVVLSADSSTALVGANIAAVGGHTFQGSAYLFERPRGGWATATETARLTASDGAASDFFGQSVALSNNGATALVGAFSHDVGRNADQGAAYLFLRPGGGWATATETARLAASDGSARDSFGDSVALSADGTTALVGNTGQGSTYVFAIPAATAVPPAEVARPEDDTDKPRKRTAEQRLHDAHTNQYGQDHYATGGNVASVERTPDGLLITLAQGRGETLLVVYRCAADCPTLTIGQYISADGEVGDDGRFEAAALDIAP